VADYALAMSDAELARYRVMAARAVASEAAEFRLAGIVPGVTVADVGAGPAAMSVEVAQLVGPEGRVIAIEPDERSRATAATVIAAAGATNVELRPGTATETGLDPGSVDVAMMRHVLAHNGGREQAFVDHLASRVRPGGCVYLVDTDLTGARSIDGPPELDDLFDKYSEFHRARRNDPLAGLQLANLLKAAGLEVLAFEGRYSILAAPPGLRPPPWAGRDSMLADGAITQADVDRWSDGFEKSDAQDRRPTIFVPLFIAIGRVTGT